MAGGDRGAGIHGRRPIHSLPEGSALAMKDFVDRSLQFLADWLFHLVDFVEEVWAWAVDQVNRLTQVPWDKWPLWKQIVLVIVAGFVLYALLAALRQLWSAALGVLSALVTFVGTLIVALPALVLASAVALGGLWLVNNFHDFGSLMHVLNEGGDKAHDDKAHDRDGPPPARHFPGETTGGNR